MKQLSITFLVFFFSIKFVYAQDTYKKRYYVTDTINFTEKFYNAEEKKWDSKDTFVAIQRNKGNVHSAILSRSAKGPRLFRLQKGGLKSNLVFGTEKDADKIYINPWLVRGTNGYVDRDTTYFYRLRNRQSVRVHFWQMSLNALSVPLKVRFGETKTEFTTGANLGALLGSTWGSSKFVHRKKIGNKQYDSKLTLGLFLGADKLEFTYDDDAGKEQEIKTAFASTGIGLTYSYQKFNIGATYGYDFGLGESVNKWDFNEKPWLGLAIGYSLFTF